MHHKQLRFGVVTLLAMAFGSAGRAAPSPPSIAQRSLKICVAADAPPEVKDAARAILAAAQTQPLLKVMIAERAPTTLTDSATLLTSKVEERAFSHLVLVGFPSDPLIQMAWQREARLETGGLYVFGFGHLRGDIGYLESDRNPFLHSSMIKSAPFETEVVTISGNTPAGVTLAANAFLKQGLVNGIIAAPGWTRSAPTLLDRDPLAPGSTLDQIPQQIGDATFIGITQASEDEYRGVLADANVEPQQIWRAKYFRPGAWDGAGAANAFDAYSGGLHRRAYGNTLWLARFASPEQAAQAAPKIAAAAHLEKKAAQGGLVWTGSQPPYGFQQASSGPLSLWQSGDFVILNTLPTSFPNNLKQLP